MSDSRIIQTRILERFSQVRAVTTLLASPLSEEDVVVQSMPDASPAKWHLAHTTWFFETFVLQAARPGSSSFHPQFSYLFNSYYNAVGKRHARAQRGLLTRPSLAEVQHYRLSIDLAVEKLAESDLSTDLLQTIELGIQHEQQHQELMLTDVKHLFSRNPLWPAYRSDLLVFPASPPPPLSWTRIDESVVEVGHQGAGFCFDNEGPRHRTLLPNFEIANRLVTNQEYLEFIEDQGYSRAEFWLSEGWDRLQSEHWNAPLYWEPIEEGWQEFTLGGLRRLDQFAPVSHISFFEADAFARWRGCRLPTEFEWEFVAAPLSILDGNFLERGALQPIAAGSDPRCDDQPIQFYGDVWEWTASPYVAYPGYRPAPGAIGEYNGKFMSSQWVLKGGSCATSLSHLRPTYRNFFHPDKRWQFTGIRLARGLG